MAYQVFRGNPENKLLYTLDNLIGGINTEFSDDTSSDVDFQSLINFDMDKMGSLNKRRGFGELSALSQIFKLFDGQAMGGALPRLKNKTQENQHPETENDNLVYAKLLRNDNNCFRNLAAFSGDKAYRKYQEMYGFQNNEFHLMLITTRKNKSYVWLYMCKLPEIEILDNPDDIIDTIELTSGKILLEVNMKWDRNLTNIDTIEFYDKIYFTSNDSCIVCFDRSVQGDAIWTDAITYKGIEDDELNTAYKPTALEVSKIGFNVLGTDPVSYVNTQQLTTDSIQGVYISTLDCIALKNIPKGDAFLVNIFYTGSDSGFELTFKEGDNTLDTTITTQSDLSRTGLKVYKVIFNNQPVSEIEIQVAKTGSAISPYYDYYSLEPVSPELRVSGHINIGEYRMLEMFNRAVYYKDDTILYSEVDNFDYIPESNYITLPLEPTDMITNITYFKNMYIVFTKHSIYKIVGALGSDEMEVSPVNLSIGCHAGKTVVPIDNMLFFASQHGLYALKSSTFVEGLENVKEIDLKVKTLTSDYTLYNEDLENPAIRYNGISEKAVAIRYKDKYLLFYNSSFEDGDYAAQNNLDVLSYQYEMKNFTTYSFVEKPTFIFKVDDAIECLSSVSSEDFNRYFDTKFLEYDMTTLVDGKIKNEAFQDAYDLTPYGGVDIDGDGTIVTINKAIKLSGDRSGIVISNEPEQTLSNFEIDITFGLNEIPVIEDSNNNKYLFQFSDSVSQMDLMGQIVYLPAYPITLAINENLEYEFGILDNSEDNYHYKSMSSGVNTVNTGVHNIRITIDTNGLGKMYLDEELVASEDFSAEYTLLTRHKYDKIIGNDYEGIHNGSYDYALKCDLYYFKTNGFTFNFYNFEGETISSGLTTGTISGITGYETEEHIIDAGSTFDGVSGYLEPTHYVLGENSYISGGFRINFFGKFYDTTKGTIFELNEGTYDSCYINVGVKDNKLVLNIMNRSLELTTVETSGITLTENHSYSIECVDNGEGYTINIIVDNVVVNSVTKPYGIISDFDAYILIGKSYNSTNFLNATLSSLSFLYTRTITPIPIYRTAMYEFDTTYSDFGKPISVELISKGVNLQYPLHLKKLKHIFVKVTGTTEYHEFMFELYGDGYLSNDPKKYYCYLDETGKVVYDYTEDKVLKIDENISLLGNMRLDKTRVGQGTYQTKKMIVPSKAKNFTIRIYGESEDSLSIESFGFVFKLGKVKEN